MPKNSPDVTTAVRCTLHSLHIPPHLLGYHYLTYIIEQVASAPMRIKDITKDLYPEAAHTFDTDWRAVERNSRTAILICWSSADGRAYLEELAGHRLPQRPKTAAFIAIVAAYIARSYGAGK